ncbi:MAG: hypothetical protein CVU60_13490 [Deltaproteobacteria bacterium HGW-Deltaproteobacteria-18]|jgi:putative membrane protein|nr:MAG: hypothetical protein CVU60_13490 [Deltaproteobacteria bacterium HGW-Deltaproteobacteria-18]
MWNCGTYPWLGGWMMGHSLWGILLLAGLGTLIWTMLRSRRDGNSAADRFDSLEILKLRLAKGEITVEEYNTLKSIL